MRFSLSANAQCFQRLVEPKDFNKNLEKQTNYLFSKKIIGAKFSPLKASQGDIGKDVRTANLYSPY